jgi:hypothetical protein
MFAAITATIAALLLHGGAAVDPVFSTATYVLQSSGNWTVPGPGMVKIRAWVRRTPRPVRCAASEPLPLLLQAGGGCGGSSASMGACHGGAGGNGGSNATVLTAKGGETITVSVGAGGVGMSAGQSTLIFGTIGDVDLRWSIAGGTSGTSADYDPIVGTCTPGTPGENGPADGCVDVFGFPMPSYWDYCGVSRSFPGCGGGELCAHKTTPPLLLLLLSLSLSLSIYLSISLSLYLSLSLSLSLSRALCLSLTPSLL